MKQFEEQKSWILFTLYSYRVDGAKSQVDIKDVWDMLAVETAAFNGFPDYYDCLTRMRKRGLIDLRYPPKKTVMNLTFYGLDEAAAEYNNRKRLMEA
ncbi:hypothetical protein UXN85_20560 [Enterobacter hormaechei]